VTAAESYIDHGAYDAATGSIMSAQALVPQRIEAYAAEVLLLYKMRDYDYCLTYAQDVVNNPLITIVGELERQQLADVYYTMGNAYLEKEDYDNAISCLTKALEYNQTNSLYHRDDAIAQARAGHIAAAESLLAEAVALGIGQDSVYMVQGEISYNKGEYEAAIEHFLQAVSAAETGEVRERATLLCAKTYGALGDEYLDQEIALLEDAENNFASAYINERLGDAYARKGRFAAEFYELAITKFKDLYDSGLATYQITENLVILYQQVAQYDLAESLLQTLKDSYPTDYRAYKRLALLEADMQQHRDNLSRDYSAMRGYYEEAAGLYAERGVSDPEMQMLENMIRDLDAGGW
jgi:tetratricopeptide (TPR) repeat protein